MPAALIWPGGYTKGDCPFLQRTELLCLILEKGEQQKVSGGRGNGPEILGRSILHVVGDKMLPYVEIWTSP